MTKTEYAIYLQSPEWKAKRADAIEYYGGHCLRCLMPRWLAEIAYDQDLHVHHKTYLNRGSENVEDLEVLCRRCHEIETFGRSELRAPKTATCEACSGTHWDYRSKYCALCENCFGERSDDVDHYTLSHFFSRVGVNEYSGFGFDLLLSKIAEFAAYSPFSIRYMLREFGRSYLCYRSMHDDRITRKVEDDFAADWDSALSLVEELAPLPYQTEIYAEMHR